MSGTDKNTRLLSLYRQLLTGKKIIKQRFCVEQGINERSFERDIEDVRLFLIEEQPYCELIYDRIDKIYYLSYTVGSTLSGEESLFLLNILLSQKNMRSDELECILANLINITDPSRCNEIYKFLENKSKVNRCGRKNAILKMHWDLERAILNCNQIILEYEFEDQNYIPIKLNPIELHIENGYTYLIAYIVDKDYKSPAFYRLDRIRSFHMNGCYYQDSLRKECINKDIHLNRFSMMAGEEISVVIQVKHNMRRVIKDIFPDHIVVQHTYDKSIYRINTYKQGFTNWLLGQGEKVLLLEPENLRKEIVMKINEMSKQYSGEDV